MKNEAAISVYLHKAIFTFMAIMMLCAFISIMVSGCAPAIQFTKPVVQDGPAKPVPEQPKPEHHPWGA